MSWDTVQHNTGGPGSLKLAHNCHASKSQRASGRNMERPVIVMDLGSAISKLGFAGNLKASVLKCMLAGNGLCVNPGVATVTRLLHLTAQPTFSLATVLARRMDTPSILEDMSCVIGDEALSNLASTGWVFFLLGSFGVSIGN